MIQAVAAAGFLVYIENQRDSIIMQTKQGITDSGVSARRIMHMDTDSPVFFHTHRT